MTNFRYIEPAVVFSDQKAVALYFARENICILRCQYLCHYVSTLLIHHIICSFSHLYIVIIIFMSILIWCLFIHTPFLIIDISSISFAFISFLCSLKLKFGDKYVEEWQRIVPFFLQKWARNLDRGFEPTFLKFHYHCYQSCSCNGFDHHLRFYYFSFILYQFLIF